jgi:hypothetical protein
MPSIPQFATFIPGAPQASNLRSGSIEGGIGAATRELGNTIGDLSQQGTQLYAKIQAASDAGTMLTIDNKIQVATQRFEDWTRNNPDKEKYGSEAELQWNNLQTELANDVKQMSPKAQAHASLVIANGKRSYDTKAKYLYTGQKIADAKGQFDGGRVLAVQTKNVNQLEGIYEAGTKAGIYSEEQIEKYRATDLNKIELNIYQDQIQADPWNDKLFETGYVNSEGKIQGYKHLTSVQITDLNRDQRSKQQGLRRDNMAALDSWRSSTNDSVTRETTVPGFNLTLGQIEKQQKIDGKWVDNLIKAKPVDDIPTMNAIKNRMYNDDKGRPLPYDYFNPETPEGQDHASQVEASITHAHLTPATTSALLEDFKKRKNGKTTDERSTLTRAMADVESLINNGNTLPFILSPAVKEKGVWFGENEISPEVTTASPEVKLASWETDKTISLAAKAKARARGDELRDGIRDFIEKHPNASYADVGVEKARIMAPWVKEQMDGIAREIASEHSRVITTPPAAQTAGEAVAAGETVVESERATLDDLRKERERRKAAKEKRETTKP